MKSLQSSKIRSAALAVASGMLLSAASLAADEASLPIRSITLYRSGVGYFERTGSVEGEQKVQLRFETSQINDILKSLVMLDLGGGQIGAVSYGSKEPLTRRLASFGVNIADNPSIPELLARLRGAGVRLTTPEGAVEGTILGVENRSAVAPGTPGTGSQPTVVSTPHVNLVTAKGIRSIPVDRVNALEFLDAELNEELNLALGALAEQRNENSAVVELQFSGAGERDVVLGYITETPVWKTSYRLVLGEETGAQPTLQGWAIVENTSDEDWTDVRLALASGNPVGFQMDLHEPVFVTRPMIAVPTMAFAAPRVYEGDLLTMENVFAQGNEAAQSDFSLKTEAAAPIPRSRMQGYGNDGGASTFYEMAPGDRTKFAPAPMATAGEIGEQFRYDISAPVTIERQRSAMLPILSAPVEGRRLSIYNPADNAEHPMRGVSFTNGSGFDLSPGPIAVYDGAAYAGDAQIAYTSRGEERLLSYAVDLDVAVSSETNGAENITKIRIVNGAIEQTWKGRNSTTYKLNNRDAQRERTIVIEHPKLGGWDLVKPSKPESETDSLLRFEVPLAAGAQGTFEVAHERTHLTRLGVTNMEMPTLLAYVQSGKASQAVFDAIQTAANKQSRIAEIDRRLAELNAERTAITQDQSRIRENMERVERNSDLYARWVQKLTEQETRLEAIVEELAAATSNRAAAQKDLNVYLSNLTVE